MELPNVPSVLFLSTSPEKDPKDLIRVVIGELPEPCHLEPGLAVYPWALDTKYYTAKVNLCSLTAPGPKFNDMLQGTVIFFDPSKQLNEVTEALQHLNEIDLEIKILLCQSCPEETRRPVLEWCIKEGFELVELEADEDDDSAAGPGRIKEALEAHIWPNLNRKSSPILPPRHDAQPEEPFDEDDMLFEKSLSDLLHGDGNFEDLFSRFVSMKERAAAMPAEERKHFAEKVVSAYWKSVGGDEDELSDD